VGWAPGLPGSAVASLALPVAVNGAFQFVEAGGDLLTAVAVYPRPDKLASGAGKAQDASTETPPIVAIWSARLPGLSPGAA
jgi:hypothetical protein